MSKKTLNLPTINHPHLPSLNLKPGAPTTPYFMHALRGSVLPFEDGEEPRAGLVKFGMGIFHSGFGSFEYDINEPVQLTFNPFGTEGVEAMEDAHIVRVIQGQVFYYRSPNQEIKSRQAQALSFSYMDSIHNVTGNSVPSCLYDPLTFLQEEELEALKDGYYDPLLISEEFYKLITNPNLVGRVAEDQVWKCDLSIALVIPSIGVGRRGTSSRCRIVSEVSNKETLTLGRNGEVLTHLQSQIVRKTL